MSVGTASADWARIPGLVYRYAGLVIILGLLAWDLQWYFSLPPHYSGDPYSNLVVGLMLLFNHLTAAFKWPRPVTISLWTLDLGWLVFGLFYVCHWSRVLYPIAVVGQN
ncbi:MAG: hypothetical protein ABFE01_24325 [Phycisphaerales bacterium]|jgi:hypothetical protein